MISSQMATQTELFRPVVSNNTFASVDQQSSSPSSEPDSHTTQQPLDFAKRKISDTYGHKLFSQLSSMTSRSPYKMEDLEPGPGEERVLDFEDQERIRSPASTEAYMNSDMNKSSHSDSIDHDGIGSSPSLISPRTKVPLPGLNYQPSFNSNTRHYEPARVVLHKIELQKPREEPIRSEFQPENVILPNSLLSTLGSSPDDDTPLRQIRELKQPIYVPAVLRQTDNNAYGVHKGKATVLAGINGQASTKHWIDDNNVTQCEGCKKPFRWFRRRHHCRKCGKVFCADDVRYQVGLDRMLNFSLLGQPSKVCSGCAHDFQVFRQETPMLNNPVAMQTPVVAPVEESEPVDGATMWSTF